MIQCRLCNLKYIGETKRRVEDLSDDHRRPILNPTTSYIHTAVSEHFLDNNHLDTHMLLIPLKNSVMNAILSGKGAKRTLFIKPKPLSL